MRKKYNIKHNKIGKSPARRYIATGAITFSLAFITAYIASAGFMSPNNGNAATNVSASISSNGYYINVTSLGEVNVPVNAASGGGIGTGTDTVHVETNTAAYKLYISTTDNSNAMYMNGDSTSIYKLNATTEGTDLSTNSWGYKLSTDTKYKPVPVKGSEALLVNQTGLTVGSSNTKDHAIVYGVKADMTIPAGTYSRTVTYSAIADASNVSNIASVSPASTYTATSGTFTITVSLPMMTNMETGSWTVALSPSGGGSNTSCTSPSATKTDKGINITCNAPKNLSAGIYTVTATSTKYGSTYTATNAIKYINPDIFSIANMQDMSSTICSNTTKPTASATSYDTDGSYRGNTSYIPQTTLTDTRDSKKYVIQKMPDGKCWMVQNLAINPGVLPASKTNIASDYTLPNTSAFSDPTAADAKVGSHTDGSTSSNGNWYSFNAATAGTGNSVTSDGGQASADICPKNWRLPNGGSSGEFQALYNQYNNKTKFDTVWHPAYPGHYSYQTLNYTSNGVYWWSRTSRSSTEAYTMGTNINDFLNPAGMISRIYGFSLRCIAK